MPIKSDDFATFNIFSNNQPLQSKSPNKSKGKWIGPTDQILVNGRQLNQGFIYFGGVLDSLNGFGVEASLVDKDLPVAHLNIINQESTVYTDETLGYWPSYESLSESCRGVYLDWLASDRSLKSIPIGYVFIYFYGIERRVIENKDNDIISNDEFIAIYNEVFRLHKTYAENRSFHGYSANLLEFMSLQRPELSLENLGVIAVTNKSLRFKLQLANVVSNELSVDSHLALNWLKHSSEYTLKTPARRCEIEFSKLFTIKYEEKYGSGIKVKPNKTKLKLFYQAASSSIGQIELNTKGLPDPSILTAPIKKLIPIAEACTLELNAYSRYLGKADTSKNDISAIILLPNKLVNESNSSLIKEFKSWAMDIIETNEGITSVNDFYSFIGLSLPKNLNKKDNEFILNITSKAKFGIAPDFRFHNAKLKSDDKLVLFKNGHGPFFEASKLFNQIAMALRLGSMVALIDGYVDPTEKDLLLSIINDSSQLSPTEKQSLRAYLIWRLNSPIDMRGLKAILDKLTPIDIQFVRQLIISVALADGKIEPSEIKQLEKLYISLGLDSSLVTSDIHNSTSLKDSSRILTKEVENQSKPFTFNEELLALHETETGEVQSMLSSIFENDDELSTPLPEKVIAHDVGLDRAHAELYQVLITKESWTYKDVFELCNKFSLMVDGAIETINEWAFDNVDAPVFDDDGDIYVDFEIVNELKG